MSIKTVLLAIGMVLMIATIGIVVFLAQTVEDKNSPDLPIRVACVGDSITEGSGYPNELWMLLGENYTVGNFGVGGTAVSFDSQTPYVNEAAFQKAKNFQPNIVIIMLGTNDANPYIQQFNATFVEDYIKIINAFQALSSKPQIWIVKPPPIFNNGTGLSTLYFNTEVIPRIQEVANKTNLPIIDVYSALANHEDYFLRDGVHPDNEQGAYLIANVIYNAIIS